MRPCYLTLDQGGQSTRALIYDDRGECLQSAQVPVTTSNPSPERVEQSAGELIASLWSALKTLAPELLQQVACAGLVAQRSSMLCWDRRDRRALTPILSWQDRRAAESLRRMRLDSDRIHASTGLIPNPHYAASKISWCLREIPDLGPLQAERALCCAPLSAYLCAALVESEHPCLDATNAARTMLWNLTTGDWDDELLERFRLARSDLPRTVPNRFAYGSIKLSNRPIPLVLVCGDQNAAVYNNGWPRTDTAYINIGTGAFVLRPTAEDCPAQPRVLNTLLFDDGETRQFALEGTVNGAASALSWLARSTGEETNRIFLRAALEDPREPPLFLNGIGGLGSPFWIADFSSRFVGEGDLSLRCVAVLESIVFLLCENLRWMDIPATPLQRIYLGGGLGELDGLAQRLADLSGVPVYRGEDAQASARGLAFLLADGPLDWNRDRVQGEFSPARNFPLQQRYSRWREQMQEAGATWP